MNKNFRWGILVLILGISLSGCSQVHFGKDAVTIGEVKTVKKKPTVKKPKPIKKVEAQSSSSKKKSVKKTTTKWDKKKTQKLQKMLNTWSKKSSQKYNFYNGQKALKTKKGATYPAVFKQRKFLLKKKQIKIGYSPLGVNKYQYNVVAIANDDFKSWHNTYLFCLKDNKPVILLDQSENTNPIMVKVVKDRILNKGFKQIYKN